MSTLFCAGVVGLGLEPHANGRRIGRLRFMQLDSRGKRDYIERLLLLNFEQLLVSSAVRRYLPDPEKGVLRSWNPLDFLQFVEPATQPDGDAQSFSLSVRSVVTLINLLAAPPTLQNTLAYPRSAAVYAVWEKPEEEGWREVPILLERPPLMAARPHSDVCCPVYVGADLVIAANALLPALSAHFDSLRVGLRRLERVFARCTTWEDAYVDLWISLESLLGELDDSWLKDERNYGARVARVLTCLGFEVERQPMADAYRLRNSVVHGHTRVETARKCAFLAEMFPNKVIDPANYHSWGHIMFNSVLFLEEVVKTAYCKFLSSGCSSKAEWIENCMGDVTGGSSGDAPDSPLD